MAFRNLLNIYSIIFHNSAKVYVSIIYFTVEIMQWLSWVLDFQQDVIGYMSIVYITPYILSKINSF